MVIAVSIHFGFGRLLANAKVLFFIEIVSAGVKMKNFSCLLNFSQIQFSNFINRFTSALSEAVSRGDNKQVNDVIVESLTFKKDKFPEKVSTVLINFKRNFCDHRQY